MRLPTSRRPTSPVCVLVIADSQGPYEQNGAIVLSKTQVQEKFLRARQTVFSMACCILVMGHAIPSNAKITLDAIQTVQLETSPNEEHRPLEREGKIKELEDKIRKLGFEMREMKTTQRVTAYTTAIFAIFAPEWSRLAAPLLPEAAIILDESTKFIGRQIGVAIWDLRQFREDTRREQESARRSYEKLTGKTCVGGISPFGTDDICY